MVAYPQGPKEVNHGLPSPSVYLKLPGLKASVGRDEAMPMKVMGTYRESRQQSIRT